MKKRLRVGILTHNYPVNSRDRKDAGIFIYDFANALAKYCDVYVFCPDFGGKKEKYKKVSVTWFNWDNSKEKFGNWKFFNPLYVYKFFKLLYIGQKEAINFVHDKKIDYCLTCWAIPSAIFALRVKQVLKTPYASWSLGSDVNKYSKFPILKQLIYLSLKSADNLYANSFDLAAKVKRLCGRDCYFLPAITNFELTKTIKPKLKKGKFNFLFVGRLEKIKGCDIFIEAVKAMKDKGSINVNILGDGTMMESIKKNANADNTKSVFNFVGWANEKVVGGYMKNCNCLVIPSRSESLPLVMIEAAKVALPIIATDVGDCKRIVNKYKIGICVEKENVFALTKALEMIAYKKKTFSIKGFKQLTNDFSQKTAVQGFLSNINI